MGSMRNRENRLLKCFRIRENFVHKIVFLLEVNLFLVFLPLPHGSSCFRAYYKALFSFLSYD